MTPSWTTGRKHVTPLFRERTVFSKFAFPSIRHYVDDTGDSVKPQYPMNNNVIENNDGNGGTAPAAPDKHYEDQATQTEDEDDYGDEDSYCSYNEYSESEQSCLSSPGGKVTNEY